MFSIDSGPKTMRSGIRSKTDMSFKVKEILKFLKKVSVYQSRFGMSRDFATKPGKKPVRNQGQEAITISGVMNARETLFIVPKGLPVGII